VRQGGLPKGTGFNLGEACKLFCCSGRVVPIVYLPVASRERMNMRDPMNFLAPRLGTVSLMLSLAISGCGGQPQQTGSNVVAVRISGQINQLGGSCPNSSFKLGSKRVGTDASSAFLDRSCSDLRNGGAVEVEGGWSSDGSVMAKRVRGQREPPESEIRGAISGLTGACPNLSFSVGTQGVITDASTRFKDRECSGIRNGQSVEVHGIRQADGRVLARDVEPNIESEQIEVLGTLRSLGGSCPHVVFSIGSDVIATNGDTRFKTPCNALSEGRFVEAKGVRQPDGRILAQEVETEDELEGVEVEVRGTIQSVNGSCPSLTFFVGERRIVTNVDSRFERMTCADLRSGIKVEAKGIAQADRSVLAIRVKLED
jgi:uncharacterized protein DUF5666